MKIQKSESIKEIAAALAKAQAKIENVSKNAENPHFRKNYADLSAVLATVRPVFAEQGLSFIQSPSFENGIASVDTMLMHSSGEWLCGTVSAPVQRQDAQAVGAGVTYCRRYALAAFAGVAQEDDDAESAVGRGKNQGQQQDRRPPAKHGPAAKGQVQPNYYPDSEFATNFPEWQSRIQAGKATPDSVVAWLNDAGFWLTEPQLQKIHAVKRQEAAA